MMKFDGMAQYSLSHLSASSTTSSTMRFSILASSAPASNSSGQTVSTSQHSVRSPGSRCISGGSSRAMAQSKASRAILRASLFASFPGSEARSM